MRSRYTAFVMGREDYLLASWHPETRPTEISFEENIKWLGLSVRKVTPPADVETGPAWVEFVARSRAGGKGQRLHERSRFLRIEGRWFYVDGDIYTP